MKNNTLKLIYLYYKDQLPLKIKDIVTTNESVNRYNTRGGKLLFMPEVNTTYYGIKYLRYNGPFSEIPIIIRTSVIQASLNSNIT